MKVVLATIIVAVTLMISGCSQQKEGYKFPVEINARFVQLANNVINNKSLMPKDKEELSKLCLNNQVEKDLTDFLLNIAKTNNDKSRVYFSDGGVTCLYEHMGHVDALGRIKIHCIYNNEYSEVRELVLKMTKPVSYYFISDSF